MEKEKSSFTCLLCSGSLLRMCLILTSQAEKCNQRQTIKIREQVYLEAMDKSCYSALHKWIMRKGKAVGNSTDRLALILQG